MGCIQSLLEDGNSVVRMSDLAFVLNNTRLPAELVRGFYQLFCSMCPSGQMGGTEFQAFYQRVFTGMNPGAFAFYDHLFRAHSEAGSSTLNFREFMQIFDYLFCGSPREKMGVIFRMCDIAKTGRVEEREVKNVIAAMLELTGLSDGEKFVLPMVLAKAVFMYLDHDGDGCLTQQEFIQGCMQESRICSILSDGFNINQLGGYK